MKPTPENLKIALDKISNDEKITALSAAEQSLADAEERFCDLTEKIKKIAEVINGGIDSRSRLNRQPVNYEIKKTPIMETDEGLLELYIFLYAPKDKSYGQSIYAAWSLENSGKSRLVLEEYLSDRSFVPGIAAYRSDAPKVVSLLEDSFTAYEQTAISN